jgi:hypothetical protein
MSNSVHVISTTFTDLDGSVSYGYRLFDDYQKTYDNWYESQIVDDRELWFEVLRARRDEWDDVLAYAKQHGAFVNNNFRTAEELAKWSEEFDEIEAANAQPADIGNSDTRE